MSDKLKQFEDMVDRHDLTFDYSDDISVWRRGIAERDAIRAAAKELPPEDVERIWNAAADRKLVAEHAPRFYWKPAWITGAENKGGLRS